MPNSISVQELKQISYNDNLIDIRGISSFNNNHIPGAKNIPFNSLIINPNKYLDKNRIYYIYCQKGYKSIKTCQILNSLGYKTINISGGYEAWVLDK